MSVKEKIIQRIQVEGPLSFHDFMEMALYYPSWGYYTSAGEKIGKNGDYYTSPCLGNFFGELIGKQMIEMWTCLDEQPFSIVEYGAGSALLCRDMLEYLKRNNRMYKHLTYYLIEKSPEMKKKAEKVLAGFEDKIKWIDAIAVVPGISGCVFSNELVDNFAVHQVIMQDELMEVFVDYNGEFTELLKPASTQLHEHLKRSGIILPPGYRTEINLQAEDWIKEIALSLHRGFVLTIDYGYISADLFEKEQKAGTLLCYHKHAVNDDPYSYVGEQDITAHVNFSALSRYGAGLGLKHCGFTSQSNFLLSLGLTDHLRQLEKKERRLPVVNRGANMLFTFLLQMGQKMKVLIQQKGFDRVMLSGMQFPVRFV